MLTELPFPHASIAPCRTISEPLVLPLGTGNPGETASCPPAFWVTLWEPLIWSHTKGIAVVSVDLNHWESDWDRRQMTCNNQHAVLGKRSSYLQCPRVNPNQQLCSSMKPSRRLILTRKLSRLQIYLILWALQPVFPCPSKELSHSSTYCLVSSGSIGLEELWKTPGRSVAQWHLSQEVNRQR